MNTIALETAITVQTFDAPATVAVGSERPEWLAVAQLAQDLGGGISAGQISTELLGGVPQVVGERVLHRCVALGLLKLSQQGIAELSELGRAALEQGKVFVPEERLWRFYFAEHPLLDDSLLHVEPLDGGNAQNERNELRDAKKAGYGRPDDGDATPDCLLAAQESGRAMSSVADGAPGFILADAPRVGAFAAEESLQLQLSWEAGERPKLLLRGKLNRPKNQPGKKSDLPPPQPLNVHRMLGAPRCLDSFTHEQIWMLLVSLGRSVNYDLLEEWQRRAERLVLPSDFSGRNAAARVSFRESVSVPGISGSALSGVAWLEGFAPSTLAGVELVPTSEEDAQLWAEWLLRESLNDYATPNRLNELAATTRERFEFHTPSLPTPQAMLDTALAKPTEAKSRFILAPHDLGLWS